MHSPFPIDHIGPALRDLESATETLRASSRARMFGDSARIAGAALALTLLAKELIAMHDERKQVEAERSYAAAMAAIQDALKFEQASFHS